MVRAAIIPCVSDWVKLRFYSGWEENQTLVVIHWISWHLRALCIYFKDSPWMINYPQNCMFSPLCTAFLICASFFSSSFFFQTSAWSERDTRRKTWLPGLPSPWEKYQLISLSHRITRSCSSNTSVESIGKQLRFDFICIVMRTAGPLNMLIILLFPKIFSKEHNSIHEAQQEAMLRCKNPNTGILHFTSRARFSVKPQVLYFHTVTLNSQRAERASSL